MAEAFELQQELHLRDHHQPHEQHHAELLAQLDEACRRVAELEALIEEHRQSFHAPEPEPEEVVEEEAEIAEEEEAIAEEEAEEVLEVPEPPRVPEEEAPHVDVAPRPAHWMLRRYPSHE